MLFKPAELNFFCRLALATTASACVGLMALPALAAGVFLAMSAHNFFFTDFLATGVLRVDLGVLVFKETLLDGVGFTPAFAIALFRADFGAFMGVFREGFGVFLGVDAAFLAGVWKRAFIGVGSGLLA